MPCSLSPEERASLVKANLKFAWWFARRYYDKGVPYDDVRQEAVLALCYAVSRFEPVIHGANIRTYAGWWIFQKLNNLVKRNASFPGSDELDEEALIADDPLLGRDERYMEQLWDAVESLPERDQNILVRRFGLFGPECTVGETAARAQVSRYKVRKSIARSVKSLGAQLNKIA